MPKNPKGKSLLWGLGFLTALCGASSSLFAREILGSNEAEAAAWAQEKGYQAQAPVQGSEGCLKNHRYVPMAGKDLQVKAAFYHPVYQLDTKIVAMVEFTPNSPLSKAQAEALTVQVAPIAGTRPPTHRQAIPATPADPCAPPNGGMDGRYTEDYLVEYFYAPDRARIEKVRVYNENIR
ncbi:MAG: hypothetical protein U1F66_03445 [bacterium]